MNKKLKKGLTVSSAAAMGMSIVLPTVSVIAAPVVTNGWVQSNGTWYYYNNGTLVKNGWAKDSKGWCFLSAVDGSWVQEGWALDSHGWGYIRNGYWVEHATWAKDSKGWNFIGANGYLDATVAVKATNPIDDATAAVVKAEASKLQADIDAATTLVNALDAALAEKAALTTRLAAIDTTLKVVSVGAINARQLQITFSQPVDEDTIFGGVTAHILNAGVLELTRVPVATSDTERNVNLTDAYVTISSDKKTITVTPITDTTDYFEGTYAVSVSTAVRAKVGSDSVAAYSGTFVAAEDTTAPTVTGVSYVPSTNKIKITLSEPADVAPTATVDGGAPETLTANDTATEYTFDNTADAGSTISVSVNGAVDVKGNEMTSAYTKSVTITHVEANLNVVSAVQDSSNTIKVVFDKSLCKDADKAAALAAVDAGLTALRGGILQNFTSAFDADDDTNATVILTFPDGTAPDYDIYPSGKTSTTITLNFGDGTLTDIYGNTNDEIVKTVSMTKDTKAPVISSIRLNSDKNAIEVVFNENITDVNIATGLTVRKDGVVVSAADGAEGFRVTSAGPLEATISEKVLTIPYLDGTDAAMDVPGGKYTVHFADDTISDAHDNNNDAMVSSVLTVTDSTTTSPITVTGVADTATNKYTVSFNGKVGDSAILASSYSLNGAALPSGTDLVFTDSDKDTVVITLPDNSVNYDATVALRNVNVKDTDGYKVAAENNNVTVVDNVKPVLTKATLTGNTLVLTYSESMDAGINATNGVDDLIAAFTIKGNAVELADLDGAAADVVTTVDGKTVTITFIDTDATDNNWLAVKAASTITVKTKDSAVFTDANDTNQKKDITVTVVK